MTTPNEELILKLRGQAYTTCRPDQLCDQAADLLQSLAERIKELEEEIGGWREDQKENIGVAFALQREVNKITSERDELREKYTDTYWALNDAARENTSLRAQLAEIAATEPVAWRGRCTDPLHDWCLFYRRQESQEKFLNMEWQPLFTRPMPARPQDHEIRAQEPVLVVEKEPDYWSGGHFHEGSKPHIKPTKVWCLPIGTKLFTRPMPTQGVNAELVEALEKLARLGNGEHYGNSDGNMIARDALSKYKGAK